jgi:hypothetical protein
LLAADLRLGELMKKLNEMEGNISSLNRRIMLLEVSIRDMPSDFDMRDVTMEISEPEFSNLLGAQESIPRNLFCQAV